MKFKDEENARATYTKAIADLEEKRKEIMGTMEKSMSGYTEMEGNIQTMTKEKDKLAGDTQVNYVLNSN
jgi:hypothetical protein